MWMFRYELTRNTNETRQQAEARIREMVPDADFATVNARVIHAYEPAKIDHETAALLVSNQLGIAGGAVLLYVPNKEDVRRQAEENAKKKATACDCPACQGRSPLEGHVAFGPEASPMIRAIIKSHLGI